MHHQSAFYSTSEVGGPCAAARCSVRERRTRTTTALTRRSFVVLFVSFLSHRAYQSCIGPEVPYLRDAPLCGRMNGFSEHGLDDESFGASKGGISSFDAFRKSLLFWSREDCNCCGVKVLPLRIGASTEREEG
jgi:hypothetical protein